MKRFAMDFLYKWKENKNRKPLIIFGARQVGKTWLMKEFGSEAYENFVYINFENNQIINDLFSESLDVAKLIDGIEIFVGQQIIPETTLIIFDEIQAVPRALTSLKYFNENAQNYQIVCAGSLLGIALHKGTSFPVGKVEFLNLYPLSYQEFILAMGKEQMFNLLKKGDYEMISVFKEEYINLLKTYYYVGGMPEAVFSYIKDNDLNKVREIQNAILLAYEQDFSKHAPLEIVPKIRMIFSNVPAQLTKENKKFIYGLVKEGARARDYELALMWLYDCGIIYKIHKVSSSSLPLKVYEDFKSFKLFILDVGLLCCMTNLHQEVLLEGNRLFKEFKGALTEQYVLQQIKTLKNIDTYYWTNDRNAAEIDFLIDNGKEIIPIEVKAETNLKSKSLKAFQEKFNPKLSLRISLANYKKEEKLINLPLYAVETLSSNDTET